MAASLKAQQKLCTLPCGVCYKDLIEIQAVTLIPCGHVYHEKCMEKWRKNKRLLTCPECRT